MTALAQMVATYSLALAGLVLAATAVSVLLETAPPSTRLGYWRGVVVLGLSLPWISWGLAPTTGIGGGLANVSISSSSAALGTLAAVSWHHVLVGGLVVGICARLLWLGAGIWRLARLRSELVSSPLSPDEEALRQELAPRAMVGWSDCLGQPVAFGWQRPVILLPRSVDSLTVPERKAVLCHELTHVARCDWCWILGEELVRAVFWFHPGIWWALDRIHLAREQVVDACVVRRLGTRKPYMNALLSYAGSLPTGAPAVSFLRRGHVAARLTQLSKEVHMSRRWIWSMLVLAFVLTGGVAGGLARMFPIDVGVLAQARGQRLEVRLAEDRPAAGLTVAQAAPGRQIYLHATVLANSDDVERARVIQAADGRYAVETTFRAAAATRLSAATTGHVGRPLAVLLDGQVLMAPTARGPIGSTAMLTGDFTRAQAEALATGLNGASRPSASGTEQQAPLSLDTPGLEPPVPVRSVKPIYPQAAQDAKLMGAVELSAVVRADGSVSDVTVTKSLDTRFGLDQRAAESVRQWQFRPATKDGAPVPVQVTMLVKFALK